MVENIPTLGDRVFNRAGVDPDEITSVPLCLHFLPPGFVSGVFDHHLLAKRRDCLQSSVPSYVLITCSS